MSETTRYRCELAWLPPGDVHADVVVEVRAGRIVSITSGLEGSEQTPGDTVRLDGLVLPGTANTHSHAFHRVLRGATHANGGTFWTWRELMYRAAAALDPDGYRALARAVFAEMASAGFTSVGEFHYLHHRADGRRHPDANAMGAALVAAARDAGIRLTLLDACYLAAGPGRPTTGTQTRFDDGDAAGWAARVEDLHRAHAADDVVVGAAVHSVRAVPLDEIPVVAAWARAHDTPLHVHVSEQPAENEACLAAYGRTPVRVLADAGALGPRTSAVHATHLSPDDVADLAGAGALVSLCPTTEADLGDGIGPVSELVAAGVRFTLGTDSHASIDPFEEARRAEWDQRLTHHQRGNLTVEALLQALTDDGQASLGYADAGRLEPGARADLVAVDLGSTRTAGADPATAAATVVFAASAADVTDVIVDGRNVVRDREHVLGDVAGILAEAVAAVRAADHHA
jgi:formiminoglutamate deiminase